MKPTLNKLVDAILQRLAEQKDGGHSVNGIRSWLLRQGYTGRDIDAALRLVDPHMSREGVVRSGPGRVRQLSDYEAYRLSEDARNALTRLDLYELIDPFEREALLERLDQFDGEVGLHDLEFLINWLISPTRDVEHQQTIYDVLDNKRGAIH